MRPPYRLIRPSHVLARCPQSHKPHHKSSWPGGSMRSFGLSAAAPFNPNPNIRESSKIVGVRWAHSRHSAHRRAEFPIDQRIQKWPVPPGAPETTNYRHPLHAAFWACHFTTAGETSSSLAISSTRNMKMADPPALLRTYSDGASNSAANARRPDCSRVRALVIKREDRTPDDHPRKAPRAAAKRRLGSWGSPSAICIVRSSRFMAPESFAGVEPSRLDRSAELGSMPSD